MIHIYLKDCIRSSLSFVCAAGSLMLEAQTLRWMTEADLSWVCYSCHRLGMGQVQEGDFCPLLAYALILLAVR